jgi:hypothetical protein
MVEKSNKNPLLYLIGNMIDQRRSGRRAAKTVKPQSKQTWLNILYSMLQLTLDKVPYLLTPMRD